VVGDDYGAVGFAHGRYAEELEVYVRDAGIPPLEVLRWATKHGAELMGLGDDLGTVSEGKLADLLVLDGDPLEDVRCSRTEPGSWPSSRTGVRQGRARAA